MYPVNGSALVFDAFAGKGVVLHDFTGADLGLSVDLTEDDGAGFGGSESVVLDNILNLRWGEDRGEELVEVAVEGEGLFHI